MIYDVIVVGNGHSACESAYSAVKMGGQVCMITLSRKSAGRLSCNPAIGGISKGHLVYEIEALGGIMPEITDRSAIQYRMLNRKKGSAVWGLRAQVDRGLYEQNMRQFLNGLSNLDIKEGEVVDLVIEDDRIAGVLTNSGEVVECKTCVVTTGTFLNGMMYCGEKQWEGGRLGEEPSTGLSKFFNRAGIEMGRLKTGTPARVLSESIDASQMKVQPGETSIYNFTWGEVPKKQLNCYITRTNEEIHRIILDNLDRSPLYRGVIKGTGARYCPSIEDKVVKFPDSKSHLIFVEPEGWNDPLCYLNGLSSSLPEEIQDEIIHLLPGLEESEIIQYGYAIEYDYVHPQQLKSTLESKDIGGLFLAGQINGTSGYEEAGGQGLTAGVNAMAYVKDEQPMVLGRDKAYIGVMIDDLITRGTDEPYRLFTSRAEFRLFLSHYSARRRLTEIAHRYSLVSDERMRGVEENIKSVEEEKEYLKNFHIKEDFDIDEEFIGKSGYKLLARPDVSYETLIPLFGDNHRPLTGKNKHLLEEDIKYEGYRSRSLSTIKEMKRLNNISLSEIDYQEVEGLSKEGREKLQYNRPENIGQASRIPGIRASEILSLINHTRGKRS